MNHSHREVRRVDFSSARHNALPVEVIDYRALTDHAGSEHFDSAQRASFGVLLLVRSGVGLHTIDFEEVRLVPGRLVYVRPGQVQQWHLEKDVDAAVVLARGRLCTIRGSFLDGGTSSDLGEGSMSTAAQ